MSSYEEQLLLNQLRKNAKSLSSFAERRLYRKLVVRQQKREHYMQLFNLDKFVTGEDRSMTKWNSISKGSTDIRLLDRFQVRVIPFNLSTKMQFLCV